MIALYRIATKGNITITVDGQKNTETIQYHQSAKPKYQPQRPNRTPAVIATSIVAVLAIVLFYTIDVGSLRASMLGVEAGSEPRASVGFVTLRDAQRLAPNYEALVIRSVDRLLQESELFMEQDDRESAIVVVEEARRQLIEFHERNPLALPTRVMLANVASKRVELGIENSAAEMIASYEGPGRSVSERRKPSKRSGCRLPDSWAKRRRVDDGQPFDCHRKNYPCDSSGLVGEGYRVVTDW